MSDSPLFRKLLRKLFQFNSTTFYMWLASWTDFSLVPDHITEETATIKVLKDICLNAVSGKNQFWCSLTLQPLILWTFIILLNRLEKCVGLSGMVLKWFRSYLKGMGNVVAIGDQNSERITMTCGSPSLIVGLLLFNLYMLPQGQIIHDTNIAYHRRHLDLLSSFTEWNYGP